MQILMTEDQPCDSCILVNCCNYKIQTLVEKKKLSESNTLAVIPCASTTTLLSTTLLKIFITLRIKYKVFRMACKTSLNLTLLCFSRFTCYDFLHAGMFFWTNNYLFRIWKMLFPLPGRSLRFPSPQHLTNSLLPPSRLRFHYFIAGWL